MCIIFIKLVSQICTASLKARRSNGKCYGHPGQKAGREHGKTIRAEKAPRRSLLPSQHGFRRTGNQLYLDFNFVYFHVTTSANECEAIKKYGILDLKQAYLCVESELRVFLDRHGIIINIEDALLTYKGKAFDISYNAGNCPRTGTQEYLCWSIGRKFYYDFTTCGFLSVWERSPYGGQVHCRPEILWDIDNLLRLKLSEEWEQSHFPYEIVAQVNGLDIVFDGDDDQSDKDKVLMYLTMAYDTAFGEPFEHILLMKNGIQISPDRIIEIKPLTCWR